MSAESYPLSLTESDLCLLIVGMNLYKAHIGSCLNKADNLSKTFPYLNMEYNDCVAMIVKLKERRNQIT